MLISPVLVTLLLGSISIAQADAPSPRRNPLTLDAKIESSGDSLTNAIMSRLDPAEVNPHRQLWWVERQAELGEMTAVPKASGKGFRLDAGILHVVARIYLRGSGNAYSDLSRFSCEPEPDAQFATQQGTSLAAQTAAEHWLQEIDSKLPQLEMQLSQVTESTQVRALREGAKIFLAWREQREREWKVRAPARARIAEWRSYLSAAKELPVCMDRKKGKKSSIASRGWELVVEPPALSSDQPMKLLARAPARRWNGLYSVRVELDWGGVSATGQFLIDSGSAVSAVSRDWLTSAGAPFERILAPRTRPLLWEGGKALPQAIRSIDTRVAGLSVPVRDFVVLDTRLFAPPRYVGNCCDGILGADFLRAFAVEFLVQDPPALRLWPSAGFYGPAGYTWVETSFTHQGDWVSEGCRVLGDKGAALAGVRWDTGYDGELELHSAHRAWSSAKKPAEIICGDHGLSFVKNVVPSSSSAKAGGAFSLSFPAITAGMEGLARGYSFILDAGNGRIWFDSKGLAQPLARNQTGLSLAYEENIEGERELVVKSIRPKSLASSLIAEGLKVGRVIREIDSISVKSLDQWNVERRLSGAYGKQVVIQWDEAGGRKIGTLKF